MARALSRLSAQCRVYIYDYGADPDTVAATDRVFVTEVGRFVGGTHMDFATFETFPLISTAVGPLQDLSLRDEAGGKVCQITLTSRIPRPQDRVERVIHYGRIQSVAVTRNQEGEALTYTSQLTENMFGVPLTGPRTRKVYDRGTETVVLTGVDVVFNPVVDNQVVPNQSLLQLNGGDEGDGNTKKYHVFTHTASIPQNILASNSLEELEYYGFVSRWSLREVIAYLLWTLNGDEKHVTNPLASHLDEVFADDDDVVGMTLPLGMYLPEALDTVLRHYGVVWYVEFTSRSSRQIRFARQSAPTGDFNAEMQRYGASVDYTLDKVESLDVTFSAVDTAANRIEVYGEVPLREVTTRLYPGWPESKDETPLEDLSSDAVKTDPTLMNVWRKWVMNESGEYAGQRKRNFQDVRVVDAALQRWFGSDAPLVRRRRKFHPMLTMDEFGQSRGKGTQDTLVEYYDPDERVWYPIDQLDGVGSYQVLDNEMGIYLNCQVPPYQLYAYGGDSVMLRITACVEGDAACNVNSTAEFRLLEDVKCAVIDLPERFVDNHIHSESQFYNDQSHTIATTDIPEMQRLADNQAWLWNRATMSGNIVLEGLDWCWTYTNRALLGCRLEGLGDRQISTDVTPLSAPAIYYPMVVGMRYRIDTQQLVLSFDTLREQFIL